MADTYFIGGNRPVNSLKGSQNMNQSLELAIWWMPSGRARLVAVSDTLTSALLSKSWDSLADAVAAYPHIKIVHTFS